MADQTIPSLEKPTRLPTQTVPVVALVAAFAVAAISLTMAGDIRPGFLVIIGGLMGVALYHGTFGFTWSYRQAVLTRDVTGIRIQLIMIGVASLLFAPVLAKGSAFGHGVGGSLAPADLEVVIGAFMFAIGMQVAGACASGTLFTVGGGNVRMVITLVFFCIGGFLATLNFGFWQSMPGFGTVSFAKLWGWEVAVPLTLTLLGLAWVGLGRWGREPKPAPDLPQNQQNSGLKRIFFGPWTVLWAGLALAALNYATLVVAGHPWSITWGLTLWGAKGAMILGWDPTGSAFWSGGFTGRALAAPFWKAPTSLMNVAIIGGAMLAASLGGRYRPGFTIPLRPIIGAVIGGLLMGYGARLAYGCNIGAFFSGIASQSLHGWIWILSAFAGTWAGVRLRPLFGYEN